MQKLALLVLTLAPFFAQADFWARPNGYDGSVPTAEQRKQDSKWKPFPDFQTIYFVDENTDKPVPENVKLLKDDVIKSDLNNGYYKVLQVRELYTQDVKIEGSSAKIPFVVGVKQAYRHTKLEYLDQADAFINQGTLEVQGILEVTITPDKLVKVKATAFTDSRNFEAFTRALGANYGTNLEWAKRIVEPSLEAYLNKPENLAKLVGQQIQQKL